MAQHKHHKHRKYEKLDCYNKHDCHNQHYKCIQCSPDGFQCYGNFSLPYRYDQIQRYYRDWNGWAPSYGIPGYVSNPGSYEFATGSSRYKGMILGHQKFCC